MTTPSNIADTVRALFIDATTLVKQEIALAKAEASEKIEDVQTGIIAIVGAMLLAFVALLVLVQALVAALAEFTGMSVTLSSLIVGVVLAIIAYISFASGQAKLSASNLKPTRTVNSVQRDAETIREAV